MVEGFGRSRKFFRRNDSKRLSEKQIWFHHEAHEGHEGFGNWYFQILNFVLFVTFVVRLFRFRLRPCRAGSFVV